MGRMLTERMQGTYRELNDSQRLGSQGALLKTWVVETSGPSTESSGEAPDEVLRDAFTTKTLGEKSRPKVTFVAPDLSVISVKRGNDEIEIFADTVDPRYWLLHSVGRSTSLDWTMERAIRDSMALDTLWLPPATLDWVSSLGHFKGLGLDFDRRPMIGDDDEDDPESQLTYLKMQLWGNKARRVLTTLRDESAFPSETTLAKVKVKYFPDRRSPEVFSVDDVKWNGKVTARGTSYEAHRGLLTRIVSAYSTVVERIERDFSISYDQWSSSSSKAAGGFHVGGEALVVRLTRPLTDIEAFLTKVFGSSDPFRLWGAPREVGADRFKVEAFDLHVGSPVRFDVSRSLVRIYLPQGACGNTIARFITNIQHHYDAAAVLMTAGGEKLGFQPPDTEPLRRTPQG